MRKYILQILRLNVYLLFNYKLLKITIFPYKSTAFTFPILLFVSTDISPRDRDPFVHGRNKKIKNNFLMRQTVLILMTIVVNRYTEKMYGFTASLFIHSSPHHNLKLWK